MSLIYVCGAVMGDAVKLLFNTGSVAVFSLSDDCKKCMNQMQDQFTFVSVLATMSFGKEASRKPTSMCFPGVKDFVVWKRAIGVVAFSALRIITSNICRIFSFISISR